MPNVFNRVEDQQRHLQKFGESIAAQPFLSLSFGLYWMQTILLFQSPYLFLDPAPLSVLSLPKGTTVVVASIASSGLFAAFG